MAGEIQLNSTSFASESSGTITINNGTLASAVDLSNHYASTSEVQGTHTTGSITFGTTSLTVASGSGISNGDYVVGEGITPGTTVSSGGGTTSITLSANAGATLSSDRVSFYKADKVLSPGVVAGGLCRAWVNFNGSGVIRNAYNVSSVTDQADSDYRVNFATTLPTADYIVTTSGGNGSNGQSYLTSKTSFTADPTTTYIEVHGSNGGNGSADVTFGYVGIFY